MLSYGEDVERLRGAGRGCETVRWGWRLASGCRQVQASDYSAPVPLLVPSPVYGRKHVRTRPKITPGRPDQKLGQKGADILSRTECPDDKKRSGGDAARRRGTFNVFWKCPAGPCGWNGQINFRTTRKVSPVSDANPLQLWKVSFEWVIGPGLIGP